MLPRTCFRHCPTVRPVFAIRAPTRDFSTTLRQTRPQNQHRRYIYRSSPLQSSTSSTVLAAFAAFAAAGGALLLFKTHSPESIAPPAIEESSYSSQESDDWAMVTSQNALGRPGNLTAEQEVKLQEFWKATLKVFGVPLEDTVADGVVDGTIEDEDEADVADDGKGEKKKKKRGLFGRKKKETGHSKSDDPKPSADADDKYGQTKEFHKALETNSAEDLRTAFWSMVKHDHPDGLLLRFLRARKWDVEKALIMMISTMHWRLKEMHVDDDIVVNGEGQAVKDTSSADAAVKKEGADFITQMRMGKSFLHGTDKEGRPMCIVRARLHKQGEQSEQSLERFTVHVIETTRLLLAPPVDTATIVFDMTGFSMANMDYTPVKFMIKVFEANYPESLGVVLVHKAPWVFQGIWKIIKGWLDPVVAGKVHFTNNVNDLANYMERQHIIKELDGEEPWEYKYLEPVEGENSQMSDTATRDQLQEARASDVGEFEAATKEWLKAPPGDKKFLEHRDVIAEKLRKGYWKLDPYVRARSLYDRTGVITQGGHIQFYPQEATEPQKAAVPESSGPTPATHNEDDLD